MTNTVPDKLAGAIAVICVGEFTVKEVATLPNFTLVTIGTNPVPVIVTVVLAGPDVGEMEVMVGMVLPPRCRGDFSSAPGGARLAQWPGYFH
ncbi:hypothetical protein LTT66_31750 [Nocardia gipuzkoensis]|nr:hypothetical protein [Nocardia gipuzkoensis]UGT67723.1 hypothetical protein LTT66_31750 [Nocardia gipuzkoensis]